MRSLKWSEVLVCSGLVLVLSGCSQSSALAGTTTSTPAVSVSSASSPTASPSSTSSPSSSPASTSSPPPLAAPCDPGDGFPSYKPGCPQRTPLTGWLTRKKGGLLMLAPFHTYLNDAQGRAYAKKHSIAFPFFGDHYDAPDGAPFPIVLPSKTICSGNIALKPYLSYDRLVACSALVKVAGTQDLPVAIWHENGRIIQVSELYRP